MIRRRTRSPHCVPSLNQWLCMKLRPGDRPSNGRRSRRHSWPPASAAPHGDTSAGARSHRAARPPDQRGRTGCCSCRSRNRTRRGTADSAHGARLPGPRTRTSGTRPTCDRCELSPWISSSGVRPLSAPASRASVRMSTGKSPPALATRQPALAALALPSSSAVATETLAISFIIRLPASRLRLSTRCRRDAAAFARGHRVLGAEGGRGRRSDRGAVRPASPGGQSADCGNLATC